MVYGSSTPQQSNANTNPETNDLENSKKDSLKAESSRLSQKAASELTKEELSTVQKLKNRDLEVKAHEQAHLSAAGSLALGGASFSYTTGPNGVRYATGGEVSIDTSTVSNDPSATLRKADAIRRAALAPASPSSQDQMVASKATSMASTARSDIRLEVEEDRETKEAQKTESTEEENDEASEVDSKHDSNTKINPPNKPSSTKGSLLDLNV